MLREIPYDSRLYDSDARPHYDVVAALQVIQHMLGGEPGGEVVPFLPAGAASVPECVGQAVQQLGAVGGPELRGVVGHGHLQLKAGGGPVSPWGPIPNWMDGKQGL